MADRTIRAVITGSSAGAVAAFEETALAADSAGKAMSDGVNAEGDKSDGMFARLAQSVQSFTGIPVANHLEDMGSHLDDSSSRASKLNSVMSDLGKYTLLGVAAGAVAVGTVAVKMGMSFQESMTQLVTGAGESQKNLKMVSDGILAMAGTVGEMPTELSKGMFLIESAGYHGAAGLSVLKAAAEGAQTGGASLATTADALTTAMHDYDIPTDRANAVTSALIETVASGKTHLEDLASSLGKVMPQAAALGINFQNVTGAMATMTNAGLSARLASMHLSNTLLAISAPSSTAATAMTSVGLTTQQVKNALDGPGGLGAALQMIEQHVGKTFPAGSVAGVNALKNIMGGTTGYSTALMLTGNNAKEFAANVKNIGDRLNGSAASVQGFAQRQKDLGFQVQQAKATVASLTTSLGLALIPKLEAAGKVALSFASFLMRQKAAGAALAILIGTVLATAITVYIGNLVVAGVKSTIEFAKMIGDAVSWVAKTAASIAETLGIWSLYFAQWVARTASTFATWVALNASELAGWVAKTAASIAETVGLWAMYFAQWVAQTAASAAEWAATQAKALVSAAKDMVVFVAEHAVAAASFIAENVAMAASATAAFVAENAATLGIVAGIALLVGGIIFLATHWHQVWTDIKTWVADAAAWIRQHMLLVMAIPMVGWLLVLAANWKTVFAVVKDVIKDAWSVIGKVCRDIKSGAIDLVIAEVTGFKAIWQTAWSLVTSVLQTAWSILQTIFNDIRLVGIDTIRTDIQILQGIWQEVWSTVSSVMSSVWSVIGPVFSDIKSLGIQVVSEAISGLETVWNTAWGAVSSAVQDAWSIVQPIFAAIKSAAHDVSSAIGAVSGAASSVAGAIGSVIPHLATGGLVTSPTVALIGEAGPEYVIPQAMFGSNSKGVQPLPSSGSGSSAGSVAGAPATAPATNVTNNITVNVVSNDPQAVIDAIRTYMQRSGSLAAAGIK